MNDRSNIHSLTTLFAKSNSMVTLDTDGYIYFTKIFDGARTTFCIGNKGNYYVIRHNKGMFYYLFH